MISKTIGFRGTLFSDTPNWNEGIQHLQPFWARIPPYQTLPSEGQVPFSQTSHAPRLRAPRDAEFCTTTQLRRGAQRGRCLSLLRVVRVTRCVSHGKKPRRIASEQFGSPNKFGYPLVNVYITMERSTIFHGKIHYKWWFSIVMLNYQRVHEVWILSSLSPFQKCWMLEKSCTWEFQARRTKVPQAAFFISSPGGVI